MPNGYLVQLGDNSLDPGDSIVDGLTNFTTADTIGAGQWTWSGTYFGTTYTNEVEPGVYYLGTDDNVYFVPDFGPVTTISSASVLTAPAYSLDNVVDGTNDDDIIDASFSDDDGDQVDDGSGSGTGGLDDIIVAGGGDDQVSAGAGDDIVYGGAGNDTIDGGAGDDTIYGDDTIPAAATESLNWNAQGGEGTNLAAGFTQSTGGMDVSVSFTNLGNNNPTYEVDTNDTQYVGGGEPFATNSSLFLFAQGDGDSSRTTIDFAAGAENNLSDEVENVTFRINDIDWGAGNHRDIVTVNAFDADGNPVAVTLTPGAGDTVSGNTVTANNVAESSSDLGGSVLVSIDGPVASIEIEYANGLNNTQGINVTDIYFDTIPLEGGDDIIDGGLGADIIDGGVGDDTITVAEGDVADGGDGDDTFLVTDLGEPGLSTITITGGEGDETAGDTLDFQGLIGFGDVTYTNTDPGAGGGLSGFATLTDGTIVTFDEIENVIICYTAGTRILTPRGEVAVESLKPGDLVVTADHGPQPLRWAGARTVRGHGALAPIEIAQGRFGNTRKLCVSPQHRMLLEGWRPQCLLGETQVLAPAKHLIDGHAVRQTPRDSVTYVHLAFDQHEVIFAEGAKSESFHPGKYGLHGVEDAAREELFAIFPELRTAPDDFGQSARRCLKAHEARLLRAA